MAPKPGSYIGRMTDYVLVKSDRHLLSRDTILAQTSYNICGTGHSAPVHGNAGYPPDSSVWSLNEPTALVGCCNSLWADAVGSQHARVLPDLINFAERRIYESVDDAQSSFRYSVGE